MGEFEIQKMAFTIVQKDSVFKELELAQSLLKVQKDNIESKIDSIQQVNTSLASNLSKIEQQNLEYKKKEDKKLQNQTRINELNSRREQDIKDIAKTLKEKEFEIQKMAFTIVQKDSVFKELELAQSLLKVQKDNIESKIDSI